MLTTILEQPDAVREAFADRIHASSPEVELDRINMTDRDLASLSRVTFAACGSSWHTALLGRYVFEEWARLPGEAEVASELRHRHPVHDDGGLAVPISQSGETVDTLMATRMLKEKHARAVAISSVHESSLARESDGVIYTGFGFAAQIAAVMLLALKIARARGAVDNQFSRAVIESLLSAPALMTWTLQQSDAIRAVAERVSDKRHFLFLGRGLHYPMALEGALMAKDTSGVHAEGCPGGEMRYGPIAVVGPGSPVVCIALAGPTLACLKRDIAEVKAKGALVIAIFTDGDHATRTLADIAIPVPRAPYWLHPLLLTLPLQLLAYHLAVLNGEVVER